MAKTYKIDSLDSSLEQLSPTGYQFPDVTDTLNANLGNVSPGVTESESEEVDLNSTASENDSINGPVDNADTATKPMAITQIAQSELAEDQTSIQTDVDTGNVLSDDTNSSLALDSDVIFIGDGFVDIDQPVLIDDAMLTIMPVTEEVIGDDVVIEDGSIPSDLILVDPIYDEILTILPATDETNSTTISEEIIGLDVVIDDGNIPIDPSLVDPIPNFDDTTIIPTWIQPDIEILPDDGETAEGISGELPLVDDNLDFIIDEVPLEDIPSEVTPIDIISEDGTIYPDIDVILGTWFDMVILPLDFEIGILSEDADPSLIDNGSIDNQTDSILVDGIIENIEYTDAQLGDPCVCELPNVELVGSPLFISNDFMLV